MHDVFSFADVDHLAGLSSFNSRLVQPCFCLDMKVGQTAALHFLVSARWSQTLFTDAKPHPFYPPRGRGLNGSLRYYVRVGYLNEFRRKTKCSSFQKRK